MLVCKTAKPKVQLTSNTHARNEVGLANQALCVHIDKREQEQGGSEGTETEGSGVGKFTYRPGRPSIVSRSQDFDMTGLRHTVVLGKSTVGVVNWVASWGRASNEHRLAALVRDIAAQRECLRSA